MKILPVNLSNLNNFNNYKRNKVSFTNTPNFEGKIKDIFKRRETSTLEEQEKSKEIEILTGELYRESKDTPKMAKDYYKTLKAFYKLGSENKFRGYIPLNEKNKEFLVFSDFDKETKLPNKVEQISMKDGIKALLAFTIISDEFGLFSVEDYRKDDSIITTQAKNNRIIHTMTMNKFTRQASEMVPLAKDKFFYSQGKMDDDNKIESVLELNFDSEDSKCSYRELIDGVWQEYKFNSSKDIWVKA